MKLTFKKWFRSGLGLVLAAMLATSAFGQKYVQMMNDPKANFYDVQREAEKYFKERGTGKGTGYKQYQRWVYEMKFKVDAKGNRISFKDRVDKYVKYQKRTSGMKLSAMALAASNWTELGPRVEGTTNGVRGIGRIEGMALHPTNSSIIYAGAPDGGLWKTTDGGTTWTCLTDNLISLKVGAVAIDPDVPNNIYFGTTDGYFYKSTDGGTNWTYSTLNSQIRRIIVKKGDSKVIFAATSNGIEKSINYGSNWTEVLTGDMNDVEFKPNDPSIVYASSTTTFYKSINGGDQFSANAQITTTGLSRIAVTIANPSYVYFLQDNNNGGLGQIYRSTDSGTTFALQLQASGANGTNYFGYSTYDTGGIAWWGMGLTVSPTNADNIFIACVDHYASVDGGKTFTRISNVDNNSYVHSDNHGMEYIGNTLFALTDGGIYKSTNNGVAWSFISSGCGIRQLYRIGVSRSNLDRISGGAQDMGTTARYSNTWTNITGGDGMETFFHINNPDLVYTTYQNAGGPYRTNLATGTLDYIGRPSGGAAWVTPFAMDPTNPNIIYIALDEIHRSADGGATWEKISNFGLGSAASSMAIAPTNSNYIYVSLGGKTYATKDGGKTWTMSIDREFNYLTVSPLNPEKVAGCGGYDIYQSTNAGSTWTPITGIPSIARCLLYQNAPSEGLYVGCEIGIYYRDNTTTDWVSFKGGLPNVPISELEIYYPANKLVAGTYGRGVWMSDLYTPANANLNPTAYITAPVNNSKLTAGGSLTISADAADLDGTVSKVEFYNGTTKLGEDLTAPYSFTWSNLAIGTFELTVKATDNSNASVTSGIVTITVEGGCTVPAWNATTEYPANSVVSYNGRKYRAKWWTKGETPGVQWGPWEDQGPCGASNQAPVVSVISPTSGQIFQSPSNIVINANATDADGTISNVEFYNGPTLLGSDNTSPYSYTWNNVGSGTYTVTAKAYDNAGASTVSTGITFVVNQSPVVSITQPLNNASFNAPANITIGATATDADGTITKVEFYNGSTLLGTDNTAPYSYLWSNVAAGTYSLTARAYDNTGISVYSSVVNITVVGGNQLPVITITAPANNTKFLKGTAVTINTNPTDADGTISKVEFRSATDQVLSTVTAAPYTYTVTPAAAGTYTYKAVAFDNNTAASNTASVTIVIEENDVPVVTITAPSSTAKYNVGGSITVTGTVSNVYGTITKVEIYSPHITNSTQTFTAAPYSATFNALPSSGIRGVTTFIVKAYDSFGAIGSASIDVAENKLPSVSITKPANNSTVNGSTVSLEASASDPDGSVAKVEYFRTATSPVKIGESSATPYAVSWSNVAAGTYTLYAVVTDNNGGVANSANIQVTVQTASCTAPQYVAGTAYKDGIWDSGPASIVQNLGVAYQCKVAGWCSSTATSYYAPGTGSAWQDAWKVVTCTSRMGLTESTEALSIYPNPVKDELSLSFVTRNSGEARITLMDMLSNKVIEKQIPVTDGQNTADLNVGSLPGGLYIISITSGSETINRRIMIAK